MLLAQAVRVPDEGKLPVSWLAGNQGEYATSTEVIMFMMMMKMEMVTCHAPSSFVQF